jgi:1,4-alpha-glucan branching enzyme
MPFTRGSDPLKGLESASDGLGAPLESPVVSEPVLGDIDLHLIGEGRHWRLWKVLGAHVLASGASFAVWAPNARRVSVVGDWNHWRIGVDALAPEGKSGVWAGVVAKAAVGARYKFAVEGIDGQVRLKADPMARQSEIPPATASVVTSSTHVWEDAEWMTARTEKKPSEPGPMRIYEVHVGSWRPGLTYPQLAEELGDYVTDVGFTHVELLPVMAHPYGGSWGYQVTGYYAPSSRFGSPDELRWFVDHLHQRGIGVIADWVPAHFPKDDWALARFDGTALYEDADPRRGEHPDWGTLVFNYGRYEVRNFLIANALYWLEEFHIDGLRVDAVASMLYLDYSRRPGQWVPNRQGGRENLEAIEFLRQLNTSVFGEHPGVVMIAEESTSWPGVSHPVHHGGLGFSHKWNMGWMHDTLGYFSHDPVHRRWHHRDLTFGLLYAHSERFVLPLSHDEVVHGKGSLLNKMPGDEWRRFASLRALYGWMWAYPGDPLLFMGGEIAQWTEWSETAGVDWAALEGDRHRGVQELVRAVNRVTAAWPGMHEQDHVPWGFQWLDADDAEHSVYAFLRWSADSREVVACAANMTPVPREDYRIGLPWAGEWQVLLDTNATYFGGTGQGGSRAVWAGDDEPHQGQPASAFLTLPPLAVLWLGARQP